VLPDINTMVQLTNDKMNSYRRFQQRKNSQKKSLITMTFFIVSRYVSAGFYVFIIVSEVREQ
jgi:hypothetical protein